MKRAADPDGMPPHEEFVFGGFQYWVDKWQGAIISRKVGIPYWFPALIFALLPTIWLFKWNKHRKLSPNACPSCGYDLTGNETGTCPECGTSITAEVTQA